MNIAFKQGELIAVTVHINVAGKEFALKSKITHFDLESGLFRDSEHAVRRAVEFLTERLLSRKSVELDMQKDEMAERGPGQLILALDELNP